MGCFQKQTNCREKKNHFHKNETQSREKKRNCDYSNPLYQLDFHLILQLPSATVCLIKILRRSVRVAGGSLWSRKQMAAELTIISHRLYCGAHVEVVKDTGQKWRHSTRLPETDQRTCYVLRVINIIINLMCIFYPLDHFIVFD